MAKKIILIVVGAVLLICGIGAVVPGALLAGVTGSDNTLESGYHRIGTPTAALVSETAQVSDAGGVRTAGVGAARIKINARSEGRPIFLGVARASDVDNYLAGVAFDEVTNFDLSPFKVDTVRHQGNAFPAPPADQPFWTASASGTSPNLEWQVADGDYRLVMMTSDGSPGVAADAQFGLRVNGLFGVGLAILIAGTIAALLGIALIILGIVVPSQPREPAYAGVQPPSGAFPPPSGTQTAPTSGQPPQSGPPYSGAPPGPPSSGPPPANQPGPPPAAGEPYGGYGQSPGGAPPSDPSPPTG